MVYFNMSVCLLQACVVNAHQRTFVFVFASSMMAYVYFYILFSQKMSWSEEHDIILLREILLHGPWNERRGSPERGKIWGKIASSLNSFNSGVLYFKVTQRSVQDHYNVIAKMYHEKQRKEARESGINPDETELEQAVLDSIERFRESDEKATIESREKKKKVEEDAAAALEMRKRSLETFGESTERNGKDKAKRQRNSGSETIQYLQQKTEANYKLRQEELQMRQQEEQQQRQQNNNLIQMFMMQQQQQSQIQQQQFQAQMQQQAALVTVLAKLLGNNDNGNDR